MTPGFKNSLKQIIYHTAKFLGLFKLSLKLTESDFRILCYHGGALHDEHLFWPGVFISEENFNNHLNLIEKYHFNVMSLDDAVRQIKRGSLPKKCVVLTFDDGFYSTKKILEPLLRQRNYPATLYVTTYYVTDQRPIFNVTLFYMFFKTEVPSFELTLFNGEHHHFETKHHVRADESSKLLIDYAKTLDAQDQNKLLKAIAQQLKMDFDFIENERMFNNLNAEELKSLHQNGTFNLQLHTHRHNLPDSLDEIAYEIQKNKQTLAEVSGASEDQLVHFCYPSGMWSTEQLSPLKQLGIISATTLDSGINSTNSDLMSLKRIVCNDKNPLIFFEAELTGFRSLLKDQLKKLLFFKNPRHPEEERRRTP